MPRVEPQPDCPSSSGPLLAELAAGSSLWRIHSNLRGGAEFRSTSGKDKRADPATHGLKGRVDCPDGEYGYLYAGQTRAAAVAEAFLRGAAVANPAARFIRRDRLLGAQISRLDLVQPLSRVDLRGAAGLGRVGEDDWLIHCDEPDYQITQRWALAIRDWEPGAQGLIWNSKRDAAHFAVVPLDDRGLAADALSVAKQLRFDQPAGEAFLLKTLSRFNVAIS